MSLNKFYDVDTGFNLKLDGGFDELKCNSFETTGDITCDELKANTITVTGDISCNELKANNVDTTNLDTTTINSLPYPQAQPPASSVFSLDINLTTYNPLRIAPSGGGAVDYILLVGSPGGNVNIDTIEGGNYNGQAIRVIVPQPTQGSVTLIHDSPLQMPTQGKFPIVCRGLANIVLDPTTPTSVMQYVDLVYVENWEGAGTNAWVTSAIQG
jgi:hypothetical protein